MIVNWLLTRKCNLKCSYCGIVRNSETNIYPSIKEINEKEISSEYVISTIKYMNNLYGKNNLFHIFYGGEPFIVFDKLVPIIRYCNDNNIFYTIITNGHFYHKVLELYNLTGKIKGLSVSLDPIIFSKDDDDFDRVSKSNKAMELIEKNHQFKIIDDLVIETTIDAKNYIYLPKMVEYFKTKYPEVKISITAYDAPKSIFYDFSWYEGCSKFVNEYRLSKNNEDLEHVLMSIYKYNKDNIHCPETIPLLLENISSTYVDCGLYKNTITIDSDGQLRLCLRIRGQINIDALDLFSRHYSLYSLEKELELPFKNNYDKYCSGCNWTCPMMNQVSQNTFQEEVAHCSLRK